MSLEHVSFKKTTQSVFDTITKDDATFYRVEQQDGSEDVYVGENKINGGDSPFSEDSGGYLTVDYAKIN